MNTVITFLLEPFRGIYAWEAIVKILDILLVAYILYRVLLMVRGTRTIAIAIGFAAIYITYVFSSRLGLMTLSNLFDAFFSKLSIFVIFALIIFQDDIRRALGRMGSIRSRAPFIQRKAIEEVVQAAGALSNKRIGAIMIFEGEADLDAFLSEGIEVDSSLTREALFALFIPSFENPMHDGAVVIRNYRIYKAAAIIRHITARADLPKDMGTRHRASIGITEETDAVAIVVSEESGSISVCFKGNLVQSVSMTDLRSLLDVRFRRTERKARGIWNLWGLLTRKARPRTKTETVDTLKLEAVKKEGEPAPAQEPAAKPGEERKSGEKKKPEGDASLDDPEVFAELLGSK